jgi:hypothetical protein
MTSAELRPLGLGDLLDRAVTLFVRRFGALVAAIAVAYVPFDVVQWRLVGWLDTYKATLTREQWTSLIFDLMLGSLVFALARTAAAAIAQAGYARRTISLRAAYGIAALRFGAQVVTQIFSLVIGFAILVLTSIPVLIVAGILGTPGTVPILIALAIAGAVALVLCAWLFLAYELATVRITAAAKPSYAALFASIRATVFRRPWHSLLAALVLILVVFGGSLVFSGISQLMPSPALRAFMAFGVGSAAAILLEALSVTFLVVYDVDLAVRREGLDLAAALEAAPVRHPAG